MQSSRWQCDQRLGPPGTNRDPYPQLLEAIDEFIDALLAPKNQLISGFPRKVKDFFEQSNLNLSMCKTPNGEYEPPPMLRRLAEMKGAEHMSELDKAKLELALAAKEKKKKSDATGDPVTEFIKRRERQKVKAAASIIQMAKFVSRVGSGQGKKAKQGEDDKEEADVEEEGKAKKRTPKTGQRKLPFGPWISNGILERGANAGGPAVQRMGLFRKKLGIGDGNVEGGKSIEHQSELSLDRDAAKADQFFHLLGWHFAQPDGSSQDVTGDLINRLLRRALAVAERRDQQVDMVKQAKGYKAELVRDLNLKLSRLHPKDPVAKEVQSRLSKVKNMAVDIEPPPPVDFDTPEWREDGLEHWQQMELERVRERLSKKWELERLRLHDAAAQTAQRMQNLDEVADVDWEQVDRPGWEVDDVLQSHDYLLYCCNLMGQLPTSELLKFLRMWPSGLESADTEEQNGEPPTEEVGVGGLQLQRYDDDGPGLLAGPRDEARKAEEKKRADRAKAAKALKLKKAKVFRAITTMKFVETTDAKTNERDKKLASALDALEEEKRRRQRVITPHEQDSFFARLLGDIDARRAAMVERQNAQMNQERESMRHFKARPYSPAAHSFANSSGRQSRHRSRSPGSGSSSPGGRAQYVRAQSPARSVADAGSGGRSPSPRAGGGFAYWHAGGSQQAPNIRARASAQQRADALQQRPASAPRQRRAAPATSGREGDAGGEYMWPSGAPVDPQQRPRSATILPASKQRALGYSSGGGRGIQGHRAVGTSGAGVGTFGQAAARPGEQRVDTSPQGVAKRSPQRGARQGRLPGKEGERGGGGGGDLQQWRQQQQRALLSDSEDPSPRPSPQPPLSPRQQQQEDMAAPTS